MRWMLFLLVTAALSGCLSEDAPDADGDTGDDADTGNDGGDGAGNDTTEPRENVTVDITWSGVYQVNGAYDKTSVTVPANSTVTLTFTNEDTAFGHDFVIDEFDGASTATLGACTSGNCASETITFDVGAPGTFKFYCSLPGHRGNGMEGDFIVE